MTLIKRIGIISITAFAFLAIATPALAVATPKAHAQTVTQTTEQQTTTTDKAAEDKQIAEQNATDAKGNHKTRLTDAKLKACQNRQTAITNIMSRLSDRGQKQIDLFSSIADKTEAFYTKKGNTLSTYDALVADLAAKKALAQTAVDTVKSTSATFKCDGNDPKGAMTAFKDNRKVEITALKNYKTAVKNLIVGVKSVQGSSTSSTNSTPGAN